MRADFVIELDHLPDCPTLGWVEIYTMVVTTAVVRKGYPLQIPPYSLDRFGAVRLDTTETAILDDLLPEPPLLYEFGQRQICVAVEKDCAVITPVV
ncbi:hypothetical protein VT84_20985 [Gemmata sp. SH-PL17]|nr:hypothetical protein VT84_20985 [Gemmata sp. SH-PL17]